jgi:hypothetical protein
MYNIVKKTIHFTFNLLTTHNTHTMRMTKFRIENKSNEKNKLFCFIYNNYII